MKLDPKRFSRSLLRWYGAHQRKLPWRGERDSYRIWISEVMLQQTRVAVVMERYSRFLRLFPTIKKLAGAELATVLAAWSGLGYYRRARALHQTAGILVNEHNGKLPRSVDKLMGLPGIGRYTASAIASIAFSEPVALVDGNVERVLTRLHGRVPTDYLAAATAVFDSKHPGDFNQAMMELGAAVCLPGRPLCPQCPVRRFCRAQGALLREPGKARRKQDVSYGLVRRNNRVYLQQRSAQSSLMPEMWELPQLEHPVQRKPLLTLRHSITDTDYTVNVFAAQATGKGERGRWLDIKYASHLPLTGLTRKILSRLEPDPRA